MGNIKAGLVEKSVGIDEEDIVPQRFQIEYGII
jgi:hypothetical protein